MRISLIDTFSFFQMEQQAILRSIPATQQQQGLTLRDFRKMSR
jgi:hypothetical protein